LKYGVEWRQTEVVGGSCLGDDGFEVILDSEERLRSRKLLLATGVRDILPDIPGFDELYGRSIHHCPYCDGYEHRDQHLAAYGRGTRAVGLAMNLRTWSDRITACTEGENLGEEDRARCKRLGIGIRSERITRLLSEDGELRRIEFASGPPLDCEALFFNTEQVQRCDLASRLGCATDEGGAAETSRRQH